MRLADRPPLFQWIGDNKAPANGICSWSALHWTIHGGGSDKKEKPVRHKQMRDAERELGESMGLQIDMSSAFIELAHFEGNDILMLDREIVAMRIEVSGSMAWVPTLRGIMKWEPERSCYCR